VNDDKGLVIGLEESTENRGQKNEERLGGGKRYSPAEEAALFITPGEQSTPYRFT